MLGLRRPYAALTKMTPGSVLLAVKHIAGGIDKGIVRLYGKRAGRVRKGRSAAARGAAAIKTAGGVAQSALSGRRRPLQAVLASRFLVGSAMNQCGRLEPAPQASTGSFSITVRECRPQGRAIGG